MMRAFLLAATLLSVGCVEAILPLRGDGRLSDWTHETEPSMAPDFDGADTFPILLVHQHRLASQREQEERAQVVCSTVEGEPLPLLRGASMKEAAASAPCMGPPVDAATGRVHMARADFDAMGAEAVVALADGCDGGLIFLGDDRRSFLFHAPAHTFLVEFLDNATFRVDGRWIEPGTALKVSYFIDKGSARDESFVRVVFDHPGEWLKARVLPRGEGDVGPIWPGEGTGLGVDVPLASRALRDVLEPALRATPGLVERVEALRVVHDGTRLTEATIRFGTASGTVTWHGAGRTGESVRMLGAEGAQSPEHTGASLDAIEVLLDMPWQDLRADADGTLVEVRLEPTKAWTSPGGVRLTVERGLASSACRDGCVLVHESLPTTGWRMLLIPHEQPAADAATLHVRVYADGSGDMTNLSWHAPPAVDPSLAPW